MKLSFSGEAYALQRVPFEIFGTLTFKGDRPRASWAYRKVWPFFRCVSQLAGVRYGNLLIVLRLEYGVLGGRLHFHFLLGGLKSTDLGGLGRQLETVWRAQTKGSAKIQPVSDLPTGVAYITKFAFRDDFDLLESRGGLDQVTFSNSVRRLIRTQERVRRNALSALAKNRSRS